MFIYNKYIQHFSTGHGRLFIQPMMVRDFFFIEIFFSIIKNIFTPFLYIRNIRPFHVVTASYDCYIQPQGKKKCEIDFHQKIINPRAHNLGWPCADDFLLELISSFFLLQGTIICYVRIFYFSSMIFRILKIDYNISVMDLGT